MSASKDGGESVDASSAALEALIRPGGAARASVRDISTCDEIWDKVVDGDARLPGDWDDQTVGGAMAAARSGDFALCAYLAARLFRHGGVEALLEIDGESHRKLWHEVVSPMVVDLPLGTERLKVCLQGGPTEGEWVPTNLIQGRVSADGHVRVKGRGRGILPDGLEGSPEHFKMGAKLQVARLRRLMLEREEEEELRRYLEPGQERPQPGFLSREPRQSAVPGAWYQVLAYPVAGDLTKAVLRRVASGWTLAQHQALWGLGETLVSQCAKAGAWGLVRTLLQKAGLHLPDLSREFEGLFAEADGLRRQWRKDLYASFGPGRTPSFVELAARDCHHGASPLELVVGSLSPQQRRSALGSDPSRKRAPLIVAMANKAQWAAVQGLLELGEDVDVSASLLLLADTAPLVPPHVYPLLADRVRLEQSTTARAVTLKEYFLRLLQGEPGSEDMVPRPFRSGDGLLHGGDAGLRVVDRSLWLGSKDAAPSWEVAFVEVTPAELKAVVEILREDSHAAPTLPPTFDLGRTGRGVRLDAPGSGDWLAVCCPRGYCQAGGRPGAKLKLPPNCASIPQVSKLVTVVVRVVTPCCGRPLVGVPVQIDGKVAGNTRDGKGKVEVRLPPGSYVASAPETSGQTVPFKVSGDRGPEEVLIRSRGDVFVYLRDLGAEGERRDGAYVCADRPSKITEDARSFTGAVTLAGKRFLCNGSETHVFRVMQGQDCAETLAKLSAQSWDGRDFLLDDDYEPWCREFQQEGECILERLAQTSVKLGVLPGAPGALAGALRPPSSGRLSARAPQRPAGIKAGFVRRPWPRPASARSCGSTTGSIRRSARPTTASGSRGPSEASGPPRPTSARGATGGAGRQTSAPSPQRPDPSPSLLELWRSL